MGSAEVIKILDETAAALMEKAKAAPMEESLDYFMAATLVANQMIFCKLQEAKK